ncbi:MAG: response regulator [Anaerolineae bacterium]|nr:response regulator [Anaerolineae bacterium]
MSRAILIVEDDPELHEMYAAMLEHTDCRIIRAHDGVDALDRLHETTPDLILLDIILGEMMGDDFFARVKQEPAYRDIPIAIISVLAPEAYRRLLEMDSRTLFLRKPFRKGELVDVVEKCLAQNHGKE